MSDVLLPSEDPEHRVLRRDAYVAGAVGLLCAVLGAGLEHDGDPLDALGWLLLAGTVVPLAWRRIRPMAVLLVGIGCAGLYHGLDYNHAAPFAASALAIYTVATIGPRRRTVTMTGAVMCAVVVIWTTTNPDYGQEMLQTSGWILAVIAFGEAVRLHHQYLAAMRERAERAERTREQEAARRVAEERVRIARDLHDLLAHSITLIGVRASVTAHLVDGDGEGLDRAAVAAALENISETCRDARADLRTTLQVLRGDDRPAAGPLPGLAGLADLSRAAESAGARVALTVEAEEPVPPVVSAAAYRIVQEALTNAVRHGGPGVGVTVAVRRDGPVLRLRVADDGRPTDIPGTPGYGLAGMRERAISIGGTFAAGPRLDAAGFAVTAELPAELSAEPSAETSAETE